MHYLWKSGVISWFVYSRSCIGQKQIFKVSEFGIRGLIMRHLSRKELQWKIIKFQTEKQCYLTNQTKFLKLPMSINIFFVYIFKIFFLYFLCSGSLVQMNLYAMHRNTEHWGDPEVFRWIIDLSPHRSRLSWNFAGSFFKIILTVL